MKNIAGRFGKCCTWLLWWSKMAQ